MVRMVKGLREKKIGGGRLTERDVEAMAWTACHLEELASLLDIDKIE